jgi:hypothetical protein
MIDIKYIDYNLRLADSQCESHHWRAGAQKGFHQARARFQSHFQNLPLRAIRTIILIEDMGTPVTWTES